MNVKLHCRENCRYHYSLLRDLIHNQVKKQHFIIRYMKQFVLYTCVAVLSILIFNTYIIHAFIRDPKFLNLTVDHIQKIRNYYKLNITQPNNTYIPTTSSCNLLPSCNYRTNCTPAYTGYYQQDCKPLYADKL
jgi:hypothetical protein